MYQITIEMVNEAIDKKYPHVRLAKGQGFHYIYSDDPRTALLIAGLFSISIYVQEIGLMTIEQWMRAVTYLMEEQSDLGDE